MTTLHRVPPTMRAMVMEAYGGPDVLVEREIPTPSPGPGEVLVWVATVAANRQDQYTMAGKTEKRVDLPHVPGNDPAGVVVGLGAEVANSGDGATPLALGDRVVVKPSIACRACAACLDDDESACLRLQSIGLHRQGGFAEYVVAPASNVFTIPRSLGFVEATALSQSGPVALHMLRDRAVLTADDVVLVTSASGAIGSAVIQLAKLEGATVIAAAGGTERMDYVRTLGADHLIDYAAEPEFAPSVRNIVPGGVSLYVESAGSPPIWDQAIKSMARRGRVTVCGSHAGPIVDLNLNWLFRNRLSILGSSGSTRRTFADALALAGEGHLRPNVDTVLPLTEVVSAFGRLIDHQNRGKVVLRVADDAALLAGDDTQADTTANTTVTTAQHA